MKEEYVFPHNNWYLKIDDDNRELVNNWRINKTPAVSIFSRAV